MENWKENYNLCGFCGELTEAGNNGWQNIQDILNSPKSITCMEKSNVEMLQFQLFYGRRPTKDEIAEIIHKNMQELGLI